MQVIVDAVVLVPAAFELFVAVTVCGPEGFTDATDVFACFAAVLSFGCACTAVAGVASDAPITIAVIMA